MKNVQKVEHKKVLLVEGKDDKKIIERLLSIRDIEGIGVYETSGKYNFKNDLSDLIKISGFEDVVSLGIIHDADENVQGAFNSIKDTLSRNKLPVPQKMALFTDKEPVPGSPRVGVFILPDGKNTGVLESLLTSVLKPSNPRTMGCVDQFMDCLGERKAREKTRLRAFLAVEMADKTPHPGLAAERGRFNLKSDKFGPLLDFLRGM